MTKYLNDSLDAIENMFEAFQKGFKDMQRETAAAFCIPKAIMDATPWEIGTYYFVRPEKKFGMNAGGVKAKRALRAGQMVTTEDVEL